VEDLEISWLDGLRDEFLLEVDVVFRAGKALMEAWFTEI
jgi:hypothetical protein